MQPGSSASKLERNVMEKHRRMQMKDLFSRLFYLIQINPSAERISLPALLDQATSYIQQLKANLEKLKEKLQGHANNCTTSTILPVLEVKEMGSIMEVNLINGLEKNFMLYEVLSVLEEEGAEVVSTSYSTVGDRVFYTIYSQALRPRLGIEVSRVRERLMQLLF